MKPAALTGYTEAAGRPEPGEFTYCPVVAGDGTVGHVWITCEDATQPGEDGQDVPCAQFTVLDDTGRSETLLSEPYRHYPEALRIPIGRQERFDTYQNAALAAARRLGDRRIDLRGIRDVGLRERAFQLLGELDALRVVAIDDHDLCSALGEPASGCRAESRGTTGDECDRSL